ncbi:hypothetical protein ACI2KR_06925 [Pseudomonas luteola]
MNWHLIDSVTLDKPLYGDPCNGCGICCIAQVCRLGIELGDDKNCKALIQNSNGSFSCGLVADPYRFVNEDELEVWQKIDRLTGSNHGEQALKERFAAELGAGLGCDSDDETAAEMIDEAKDYRQLSLSF